LASRGLRDLDSSNFMEWVLGGGEDHVLLGSASAPIPGFVVIGKVLAGSGVTLDGKEIWTAGYSHSWR
ncbi:MAG: hypothetical protein ACKO8Y_05940, partial [Actinomycetota bacterium]